MAGTPGKGDNTTEGVTVEAWSGLGESKLHLWRV